MNGKSIKNVELPATREDALPRKYVDKYIHNASNDGDHTSLSIWNTLNHVNGANNNTVVV